MQFASRRVISPCGEYTRTLRLTSELVDLRVGYAKRIRRAKLAEPQLRSSVNMMHAVASYLRRGIEAVIMGELTPKGHRPFGEAISKK